MLYPCCVSSSKKLMILIRRSQRMSSSVLESWSALAPKMQCHVPDLMQVIITRLSDPPSDKRDAALRTLGQVCSSTGYVIAPLIDYPQLLPLLGRILQTEVSQAVRREVVKVLGILGALDPYRRKVCLF